MPESVVRQSDWRVLFVLVGFSITMFDSTVVAVMLPHIATDLNVSEATATWTVTAYLVSLAAALAVTGSLGDRFGPRRLHVAGLGVFAVASVWCALSHSAFELTTARFVQGLGAALVVPQTQAIISRAFPAERRGMPMALMSMALAASSLAGPVLGGMIVSVSDWRTVFWINVPICVVAVVLALVFVPDYPGVPGSRRYHCVPFYFVGLTAIIAGLQMVNALGFWSVLVAVSGVVVVYCGFVIDNRAPRPFISARALRTPSLRLASLGAMSLSASLSVQIILEYMFLERVQGLSSFASALVILPVTAVSMIGAPVVGKLIGRVSTVTLTTVGMVSMIVGLLGMAAMMYWHAPTAAYPFLFAALGVSQALVWSPLAVASMEDATDESAGAASGVYNEAMKVGGALGAGITALMLALATGPNGIAVAFLAAPVLIAPGLVAVLRMHHAG